MKKKINVVAICGEAGSGKDRLLQEIVRKTDWHEIISCTTRPPREKEMDGVNYHFLTNEQFAVKVVNGEMLEATIFNDWCYGTDISALVDDKINIGIFNPEGIENLMLSSKINLKVFYIFASPKERLLRQLNREKNPNVDEIIRRFNADKKDFSFLDFPHISLSNNYIEDLVVNVNTIEAETIKHFYNKR